MFMKQKNSGQIKGRVCADGRPKRNIRSNKIQAHQR